MDTLTCKNLLNDVINDLPPDELKVVYKLFSGFIRDYQDRRLTPDEYSEHMFALNSDEWYE